MTSMNRWVYGGRALGLGVLGVVLALVVGVARERQRARRLGDGPTQVAGRVERCLACHIDDGPPDGAHAAVAVGCSACHLGDPLAFDKARAHVGLEREPGALDTVAQTCGQVGCHPREMKHVAGSIMSTAAGIVSVNRWTFGELRTPDGHQTMEEVLAKAAPSPGEHHLRRLCGGCHLGARRDNRDDAIHTGGSGCGACHVAGGRTTLGAHPTIDPVPSNDRCLGCHSRSGRVSLSYQGLAEVTGVRCEDAATLHDGRAACQLEADVHHRAGLACVDCHLHSEVMGDGRAYAHKEGQLELSCEDCHGPTTRTRRWGDVRAEVTEDILRLRGQVRPEDEAVRLARRGTPVWNLRPNQGGWWLSPKAGGAAWRVKQTPDDANHRLVGHERLDCSACHAAWAPRCLDCHVEAVPDAEQWDFGRAAVVKGGWRERTTHQGWGAPALAVVDDRKIAPAIPGMVMTLDARAFGGTQRATRLYATLDPHTTQRVGRSCESCHRDPFTLGLGEGNLRFDGARPVFSPRRPDAQGKATDRWTHLDATRPGRGTRTSVRSLNRGELGRVLQVAVCLKCHAGVEDPIYVDFHTALSHAGTGRCTGPQLQ